VCEYKKELFSTHKVYNKQMDGSKIGINDLLGSDRVDIHTPIIVLTGVNKWFFKNCGDNVCSVNTEKIYKYLSKYFRYIDRFVPVGQIKLDSSSKKSGKKYILIMANTKIVPVTNTYEAIGKNLWVGVIRKADKLSRSLGTIRSYNQPTDYIPVFPSTFLKKYEGDDNSENFIYSDLYSDSSYGRWILNSYKFNVDKRQLKMIDSTGVINNMTIPDSIAYYVTPNSVIDDSYSDSGKKYNRNVYFTAQGSITSDNNCVPAQDNMNKMSIGECNARKGSVNFIDTSSLKIDDNTATNEGSISEVSASDDGTLSLNESSEYNDVFSLPKKENIFKIGKKLILKEKDEPWFKNSSVVGSVASVSDPHKVTGKIGTVHGGTDEVPSPFNSDCIIDHTAPRSGYSRYDKYESCKGQQRESTGYDDSIEQFSDNESENSMENINNVIMYVLCLIIIILLFYRRS
jgi:hypothetical protein